IVQALWFSTKPFKQSRAIIFHRYYVRDSLHQGDKPQQENRRSSLGCFSYTIDERTDRRSPQVAHRIVAVTPKWQSHTLVATILLLPTWMHSIGQGILSTIAIGVGGLSSAIRPPGVVVPIGSTSRAGGTRAFLEKTEAFNIPFCDIRWDSEGAKNASGSENEVGEGDHSDSGNSSLRVLLAN
ncbi:14106_t:CDS:2, partial [Acaulospora colombiana]